MIDAILSTIENEEQRNELAEFYFKNNILKVENNALKLNISPAIIHKTFLCQTMIGFRVWRKLMKRCMTKCSIPLWKCRSSITQCK